MVSIVPQHPTVSAEPWRVKLAALGRALPLALGLALMLTDLGAAVTQPDLPSRASALIDVAQASLHVVLLLCLWVALTGRLSPLAFGAALVGGWVLNQWALIDGALAGLVLSDGADPATGRVVNPQYVKMAIGGAALAGLAASLVRRERRRLDVVLALLLGLGTVATTFLYHRAVPDLVLDEARAAHEARLLALIDLPEAAFLPSCAALALACQEGDWAGAPSVPAPPLGEALPALHAQARAAAGQGRFAWSGNGGLVGDVAWRGWTAAYARSDGGWRFVFDARTLARATDAAQASFSLLVVAFTWSWVAGVATLLGFHRARFRARRRPRPALAGAA